MKATTTIDWVDKIGEPAFHSICCLVAALNCDYDRLEELREEREEFEPERNPDGTPLLDDNGVPLTWEDGYPRDAEELEELEKAAEGCESQDDARNRILEDALSVRVFGERIGGEWQADKFEILLATGGPAVRIVGELSEHGEPTRARLEVQDWFKPWTEFNCEKSILMDYCRQFYFGE